MKKTIALFMFPTILLAAASCAVQQATTSPTGKLAFTISTEDPNSQCYQVRFRCDGLQGPSHDFKMPVWTPGYYGTFDFAGNVQNFRAEDGRSQPLEWEKTNDNTWTVQSGDAETIVLGYDVKATSSFVAQCYLDENKGYIVPTGLCMFVDDRTQHPVTVEIIPNPNWSTIATGLDSVSKDEPHTYYAPDFDVLYDSPILMGNLESLPPFEIQGVPHYFFGYGLSDFDHAVFMNDLKRVLETAIGIIGEIPYTHYTFLGIGPGRGGIEHLNSTTVSFSGKDLDDPQKRAGSLSYLTHEYFHHYNVKRIRPIALGPFDYEKPNLTNMLWVSEGFTVYYQFLIMARAGLQTQEQFLENVQGSIAELENNTGRLFQSVTESSWQSWTQGPFGRGRGGIRKTISYYNKGAVLGFLLDLKIRHETQNKKSLDDVMRTLYYTYYKDKQRGFTDEEFQHVCEATAGCPLPEIFEYASTTIEIDYPKYLAYAGLELEEPETLPEPFLGVLAEDQDDTLMIAAVEPGSPAQKAGLTAMDVIDSVDGEAMDAKAFNEAVASKQPGDVMEISFSRDNQSRTIDVRLKNKPDKRFDMKPVPNPTPLQADILKSLTTPSPALSEDATALLAEPLF